MSVQYTPSELAIKRLREKQRIKRLNLREKRRAAANFVAEHNKAVGSAAYIASDIGFTKKNRLPAHFNLLINNVRKFVFIKKSYCDRQGILHALSNRGHKRIFEILLVLLTNCDLLSGQIGKAKSEHMDTTSHDALMLQYARRFGYTISSSSWYRYISVINAMGIFVSKEIKRYGEDGVTVRSEASYKWLSKSFLRAIGAFDDNLLASIKASYQKALKKGLSFVWREVNAPMVRLNTHDLFNHSYSSCSYSAPPQ